VIEQRFVTVNDLAAYLADSWDLGDVYAIADAIRQHRTVFGRYEDITPAQLARLERLVWHDVTAGAEWPWGED